MTTKKKMLQAAAGNAGNAGGGGLDIDEVFSTYLYESTGSAQTITNGIDLDGEGGLVWTKQRDGSAIHGLVDTERGRTVYLDTNSVRANRTTNGPTYDLTSFNSDGFSLGQNWELYGNNNGNTYASWTFRKAPKFFDVVTYTGNGPSNTQNISHNLGADVGMLVVKATSTADNWHTWHRGFGDNGYIMLNATNAKSTYADLWDDTAPTSTHFTVSDSCNTNNVTYVAYLFAHNDGDGDFGPDGSDIIKCGSYTGNGSTTGPVIDLGFEPQWLLIRNVDRADDWVLIDSMRGIPSSSDGPAVLRPESSAAEYASGSSFSQSSRVDLTATGFDVKSSNSRVNGSNQNMIYIAIRRPMAMPESATDCFAVNAWSSGEPNWTSGFPVDFSMVKSTASSAWYQMDRLRGEKGLGSHSTDAESSQTWTAFDNQNGFGNLGADSTYYSWMWKRAPNYMDVVAYTGNGTAGRTVSHNLGVAPEMMWVKRRDGASSWITYWESLGATKGTFMDTNAPFTSTSYWNDTAPTNSVFSLGNGSTNTSSGTFITYLFATLAGISKVGSVTHSGTTNVDCGFSAGSRFVLLKRTDASGDWYIYDSTRGIVSGNDPYLLLNSSAAEVTNTDYIDPLSSGFTITSSFTAGDYIFYAIA